MCLAAAAAITTPITKGESIMSKTQDVRPYSDGPVTELDYIQVEYGHFEEYVEWLNATWKPTMEAMKNAELVIGSGH